MTFASLVAAAAAASKAKGGNAVAGKQRSGGAGVGVRGGKGRGNGGGGLDVGKEAFEGDDSDVRQAAALLKEYIAGAEEEVANEALYIREEDVELDLEDPDGMDAAALAILCKTRYKSRRGQLNHPTRYLGVWKTAVGLYKSCIWNGKRSVDGRRRYKLGLYASADDAARAYDRAAIAIKGDLALTNFPPPPVEDASALRQVGLCLLERGSERERGKR